METIAEADLLVAKGGSWLFSYPAVSHTLFTQRMLHPMRVAHVVKTPAIVLGTSLGPWSPWTAPAYRSTLRKCAAVVVRERLSRDFATAHNLTNVIDGKDMAYGLYAPTQDSKARSGIAITPRHLPYVSETARTRYEAAVIRTSRILIDELGEPCHFAAQVDEDIDLCHKLAAAVDRPGQVQVADHLPNLPLSELVSWYGARTLLLGTRIHSVILAAMAHTPSVILECDPPKMVGISEDLGLTDTRIDTATEAIDRLPEHALEVWARREVVSRRIEGNMATLRDQIDGATAAAITAAGLTSRAEGLPA